MRHLYRVMSASRCLGHQEAWSHEEALCRLCDPDTFTGYVLDVFNGERIEYVQGIEVTPVNDVHGPRSEQTVVSTVRRCNQFEHYNSAHC